MGATEEGAIPPEGTYNGYDDGSGQYTQAPFTAGQQSGMDPEKFWSGLFLWHFLCDLSYLSQNSEANFPRNQSVIRKTQICPLSTNRFGLYLLRTDLFGMHKYFGLYSPKGRWPSWCLWDHSIISFLFCRLLWQLTNLSYILFGTCRLVFIMHKLDRIAFLWWKQLCSYLKLCSLLNASQFMKWLVPIVLLALQK